MTLQKDIRHDDIQHKRHLAKDNKHNDSQFNDIQ